MVLLKNVSQRWHIDINMPHTKIERNDGKIVTKRGERFKLFSHNAPVEVPDEALELPFVQEMLANGSIVKVEKMDAKDSLLSMSKNDLIAMAEMKGVEIKSNWNKSEIVEKLI